MKKVYAIFFDGQNMYHSFNKNELETFLKEKKVEPLGNQIIDFEIDDVIAEKLSHLHSNLIKEIKLGYSKMPEKYIQREKEKIQNLLNSPDGYKPKNRVAVFFRGDGSLFWSPSLNNLKGFYERSPQYYMGPPQDIVIPWDVYYAICARFHFECDNF